MKANESIESRLKRNGLFLPFAFSMHDEKRLKETSTDKELVAEYRAIQGEISNVQKANLRINHSNLKMCREHPLVENNSVAQIDFGLASNLVNVKDVRVANNHVNISENKRTLLSYGVDEVWLITYDKTLALRNASAFMDAIEGLDKSNQEQRQIPTLIFVNKALLDVFKNSLIWLDFIKDDSLTIGEMVAFTKNL